MSDDNMSLSSINKVLHDYAANPEKRGATTKVKKFSQASNIDTALAIFGDQIEGKGKVERKFTNFERNEKFC